MKIFLGFIVNSSVVNYRVSNGIHRRHPRLHLRRRARAGRASPARPGSSAVCNLATTPRAAAAPTPCSSRPPPVDTTGNDYFAECRKHSAKPKKHSAKALPSVALGKGDTAQEKMAKGTLPSAFCRALGKDFAECLVPHSAKL
jgi:hypothetical protein